MGSSFSWRGILIGAFTFAVLGTGAVPSAGANVVDLGVAPPKRSKVNGSKVVASPVRAESAATGSWLTPQRMRDAIPVQQPTPETSLDLNAFSSDASTSAATGDFIPGSAAESTNRIHGKIFLGMGDATYVCSGTVVESAGKNVVMTAGHCVYNETTKTWFERVAFVPGYLNRSQPYGIFDAKQWFTTQRWIDHSDSSYDIGLVTLHEPVEQLGARKVAFDLGPRISKNRPRQYTVLGYPQQPIELFDGESLRGCKVRFDRLDNVTPNTAPFPMAVKPCNMRQGASGGGWITLGNYLSSVTAYGYCPDAPSTCGTVFGPVFSSAAKGLYSHSQVGGSYRPTIRLVKAPPKIVRKRSVPIRVTGNFATLPGFYYRVNGKKPKYLSGKVRITGLSPGKHTVRIQAVDQLGKKSSRTITRKFRVVLKQR